MNNNCIAIGRLTKDIELKYTNSNKAVIELPLALNNGKTADGQEDTTFITITIFGANAENCAKYCKKGDLIGVNFMIKNHNWTDKENKKHYDYNFLGNRITFLSSKKEAQEGQAVVQEPQQESAYSNFQSENQEVLEDLDDSLPF